ncbi:MAG: 8-oxo-dGTP diphosphatase [Actinomycetota bacterium]|nr:8-oxo-dGTP diphosphatase [Actinomycetota bacterium]
MAKTLRQRVQTLLLGLYRRLPMAGRLLVVRTLTPSFHVGALCVIERADGALLLLRQSYRRKEAWGFPGGLLKRGEEPADAVRREIREELGVDVEVDDAPMVVVEARYRRVDVIFRGRLAGDDPDPPPPAPASPEIVEVRWFDPKALPILLPEATTALVELARATRPASESG